jgi:hypothetical protein
VIKLLFRKAKAMAALRFDDRFTSCGNLNFDISNPSLNEQHTLLEHILDMFA